MSETMVERVARAICLASGDGPPDRLTSALPNRAIARWQMYEHQARAAIEATQIEQMIINAYVRGVEWNEENPLDREYRFKAAGDYADAALATPSPERT
ncbi:hypothetical protein LB579_34910 [Mesorhizobium sp. BR1-1-7]|uniref:hypothetical protein n=1 Tax=Mesorhizobium sp. BR1-1-7 TaxID=2876647 RepID=UPI001CCC29C6|nr:hypothetical protein [Mesorhizobium sp. BR1-1-7]MBZ9922844.1 hypothetical protein [Mesorhizobium sp. BR1-1-7]